MDNALSKEEWEECGPGAWTLTTSPRGSDWFRFEFESSSGYYAIDLPDRHGLAALALYGQSYGFTRKDLQTLEDTAFGVEMDGMNGDPLREIRARIARLLPPEGVTSLEGKL